MTKAFKRFKYTRAFLGDEGFALEFECNLGKDLQTPRPSPMSMYVRLILILVPVLVVEKKNLEHSHLDPYRQTEFEPLECPSVSTMEPVRVQV